MLHRLEMTWADEKKEFYRRNEELQLFNKEAIRSLGQAINQSIYKYVQTAGISTNPNENTHYVEANKNFLLLTDKQKQFSDLNRDLMKKIKELSNNSNINSKLQTIGSVRNDIVKLEKELKEVKQDADTSRTRESTIKHPRENLSWYQGFGTKVGFTKPLHIISVPILIGFGILLLFLSGLLLQEFFIVPSQVQSIDSDSIFSFFTDSRFYSLLAGISFVSIVIGILAYTGRLGKNAT